MLETTAKFHCHEDIREQVTAGTGCLVVLNEQWRG
jgi:hypothetical protein